MSTIVDTGAVCVPAVRRAITLKALDRTLDLQFVSGSGAGARIFAEERDTTGKVLARADGLVGEMTIGADGYPLVRVDSSAFSLTPKGAERVQAWLQQLRGAP